MRVQRRTGQEHPHKTTHRKVHLVIRNLLSIGSRDLARL